jgi:hypothetical protein
MQELLDERARTHGPFAEQWTACQDIKNTLVRHGAHGLPPVPLEALENIASKLSRICVGSALCEEHWIDIAGYCTRVAEWIKHQQPVTNEEFNQMVAQAAAKSPISTPFYEKVIAEASKPIECELGYCSCGRPANDQCARCVDLRRQA